MNKLLRRSYGILDFLGFFWEYMRFIYLFIYLFFQSIFRHFTPEGRDCMYCMYATIYNLYFRIIGVLVDVDNTHTDAGCNGALLVSYQTVLPSTAGDQDTAHLLNSVCLADLHTSTTRIDLWLVIGIKDECYCYLFLF